ncbi:MAG: PatB family C-S lyase [Dehalococcoidia bacterium]
MSTANLWRKSIPFDFDTPIDRSGTASLKWDKYRGRDIIPMWVADMDFPAPPAVLEALHSRVDHGVFGYTFAPDELAETVVSVLRHDYGWEIESDWIVWLPGLVTGLNVTCRTLGDDGDDVLTTVPIYPPFLTAPRHSRRNLLTVPLIDSGGRWEFDFDRLEGSITPRTRLFILCNPHNPAGRVFTREELNTLSEICRRHDVTICSDEIHCGLVLDRDKGHIPTAALSPEIAERTITLMAPSKTFNIPGLGCSFAVIPDSQLRKGFRQAAAGIVPFVNTLGYTAALAAYRNGAAWLEALLDYLRTNRDMVESSISGMRGLSMNHVEATYLAWIDTRELGLEEPAKFFEDAGVGLSDGMQFDGPGFLRLNFGCPKVTLERALGRMRNALSSL